MQAYVTLGDRTPAERSNSTYPIRQYRQLGRPSVNKLESYLTPNSLRNSTVTLNHGPSFVTLNDNSNSSSFFSSPRSPMSSIQSQFTPNYHPPQQQYRQTRTVPMNPNSQSRLQCRTQVVRETDPITGELLPPIKVSYTIQSAQPKPIGKDFEKACADFERVQSELSSRFPLSSLRR